MQKDAQVVIVIVAVCLVVMASGIYMGSMDLQEQQYKADLQQETISAQYPVLNAEFHSPEVIIKTDDTRSFLTMAKQVNATVIYKTTAEGYVAVDNDFKYAYNLSVNTPVFGIGYFMMVLSAFAAIMVTLYVYALVNSW